MKILALLLASLLAPPAAGAGDLQARIDAARPGETLRVPAGEYGAILIDKPLTLVGEHLPVIHGGGRGQVVRITAADVTLRGFRVAGSGLNLFADEAAIHVTGDRAVIEDCLIEDSLHGIYLRKVVGCRVLHNRIRGRSRPESTQGPIEAGAGRAAEDCAPADPGASPHGNGVHQWSSEQTLIAGNEISGMRDGIYFSFTHDCRVLRNRVHHVRYGLHYMYSDGNTFEDNVFAENAAGAAVMFSKRLIVRRNRFISNRGMRAYGLIFQSTDQSLLEQNEISRNAVGLSFNQCNGNTLAGNRLTRNYIGLRFGSNSDDNRFTGNVFGQNLHPVELAGETPGNLWTVAGVGNRWDDATGPDLDGDGIFDFPHRELDLLGPVRRDFPAVALLSEAPGLKLLRFAHGRARLPGVAMLEDRAPLAPTYWKIRAQRAAAALRRPPAPNQP